LEEIIMEYVYAAMLLHKAGKEVNEAHVKKVLEAAGVHPDEARVKALVASLAGVNIKEAIEKAATPVAVAAAPAASTSGSAAAPKEDTKKKAEEEKKTEEAAAAGLGALFG
jgi:large subunit ribosomal protein L12